MAGRGSGGVGIRHPGPGHGLPIRSGQASAFPKAYPPPRCLSTRRLVPDILEQDVTAEKPNEKGRADLSSRQRDGDLWPLSSSRRRARARGSRTVQDLPPPDLPDRRPARRSPQIHLKCQGAKFFCMLAQHQVSHSLSWIFVSCALLKKIVSHVITINKNHKQ